MSELIDPEVWHVVFAVVGWRLRRRQGDAPLPAEAVEVAQAILQRRKQQQKGQDKP